MHTHISLSLYVYIYIHIPKDRHLDGAAADSDGDDDDSQSRRAAARLGTKSSAFRLSLFTSFSFLGCLLIDRFYHALRELLEGAALQPSQQVRGRIKGLRLIIVVAMVALQCSVQVGRHCRVDDRSLCPDILVHGPFHNWGQKIARQKSIPQKSSWDCQRHFPMNVQLNFPTDLHLSVAFSKGLPLFQWTLLEVSPMDIR